MRKYTKNSYNSMAKKKKGLKMGREYGPFLAILSAWLSKKSLVSISLKLPPSKMSHSGSLWPVRWFGQDICL